MPRGDRTGPMGMGPMTGRAAGYCAGSDMPGYATPGPGMGLGRGWGAGGRAFGGFGGGRGWRNWFYATGQPGWMSFGARGVPYQGLNPEMEKPALKSHARVLQSELDFIKKRLSELEAEPKAE
jgi:hypothetical protein